MVYEKYCFVRLVLEFRKDFIKMFIFCLCVYGFEKEFLKEMIDFVEVFKIIMVDCVFKEIIVNWWKL